MDKALLPFGLHHLIAFPIEYSAVGGTMTIDGTLYEGVRNIINGQAASAAATGYITRNFTTGRVLFQLAGLPGAAFAMYKCAKPENRKKVASLLIPAVLTLALVGISEPIEYTFLFASPILYWLVYAPLCGLCYVLTELTKVSINGNALFFMFNIVKGEALPYQVAGAGLLYSGATDLFSVIYLSTRYSSYLRGDAAPAQPAEEPEFTPAAQPAEEPVPDASAEPAVTPQPDQAAPAETQPEAPAEAPAEAPSDGSGNTSDPQ